MDSDNLCNNIVADSVIDKGGACTQILCGGCGKVLNLPVDRKRTLADGKRAVAYGCQLVVRVGECGNIVIVVTCITSGQGEKIDVAADFSVE